MLSAERPAARAFLLVSAAIVVVALVIQIPITARTAGGFFMTPATRVGNLFTFFTILSNVLVAVTDTVLALRPHAHSLLLRVARFDAVLAITVTGVVYHVLLAPLDHQVGAEAVANQLFHTVTPVLAVVGWLVFGPRGLAKHPVLALSVLYPVAWLVFTLARGAVIGWYPYPFLQVGALGYGRVALNCAEITLLFLVLAACYAGVDRLLTRWAGRQGAQPDAKIEV